MSQPDHDNSHDYQHILRVVSNANLLLASEQKSNPDCDYDTSAIFLAALLHDVGDHKYANPGEDLENQIANMLRERGCSDELAQKVETIVKNVGYTNETTNPGLMAEALLKYPELAIVQDADRLDAIGAVGIARCFSYGAVKVPHKPMSRAIDHFDEKLYSLADKMKTKIGKDMAAARTEILKSFATQFNEESKLSFVSEQAIAL